jgi:nucleoside-diphosphate-sugar epimerase
MPPAAGPPGRGREQERPGALVTGCCALVSGATGFLGSRLAVALRDRGYDVRALARRTSDLRALARAGIEVVEGDVTDAPSLVRAVTGRRVVFHTAGKVADWGRRDDFIRTNVAGTANVVAACRAAGVSRLVHVSSLAVLGLARTGERVTEQAACAASDPDPYTHSKIEGEKLVAAAHGMDGLATTVVRPGVIWGRGDVTIVPRIVALLERNRMVLIDGGRNRIALSHVDNLAEALMLAAEAPGAAGQLYHVTDDEELTAREAILAIAEAAGFPAPRRSLPFPVVHAVASLLEGAFRIAGRKSPPPVTRLGARLIACDARFDIGKARRDIGYRPKVTFREGVGTLGLSGQGAPR